MGLRSYLIKRAGITVLILWIVATINFLIFFWYPGDPIMIMLSAQPGIGKDLIEMLKQEWGLADPIHIQYFKYLKNMFTFGLIPPYFGVSFHSRSFVAPEMASRLRWTLLLLGSALLGSIIIGIPIGILAASKRGTKIDAGTVGAVLVTWGVPAFFIQLLSIVFFVHYLQFQLGIKIFPRSGPYSYPPNPNPFLFMFDVAWHFALPILTLVVAGFGSWALYTRNLLLDALTQDFVVTARAKGLSERTVLFKHAFRSILPPIATMITMSIPGIVTGAIITESIFGLPGIGSWYIEALTPGASDYPVAQAVLFVYATLVIIFNFIADMLYGVLDPRIRVGERR